mgnify:CR=1 FL=1
MDFGDAPDPSYPTLLASDGARHVLSSDLYLGANVDAEPDGQPTAAADGDDLNEVPDDEDGVTFLSALVAGNTASVDVTASKAGLLDAWIDFDDDGSWADPGERIFTSQALSTGVNNLTFAVPATAALTDQTFARFRFSSQGVASFTGPAPDGEVEDYELPIYHPATISFANDDSLASEAAGTHSVAVTLSIAGGGTLASNVTIDVDDLLTGSASAGGSDYTFADPTTVTFPAGSTDGTSQSITLTIIDDAILEEDETLNLQLTNLNDPNGQATIGTKADHQVVIADNDTAAVTVDDVTVTEGGTMTFTLSLDNAVQDAFDVNASFADVSATGGADYANAADRKSVV